MNVNQVRHKRYFYIANVTLLIIGALIIVTGVTTGKQQDWSSVFVSIGSGIVVVSLLFFLSKLLLFDNQSDIQEKLELILAGMQSKSQAFQTRSQINARQSFDEFVNSAKEVFIGGIALRVVCREYRTALKMRLQEKANLRFLVLDPRSQDVATIADAAKVSADYIASDIRATLSSIEELQRYSLANNAGSVRVRLLKREPVFSFLIRDSNKSIGIIRAELRVFGVDLGSRPGWELAHSDGQWYEIFMQMCEALWDGATPYDRSVNAKPEQLP